MASDRDQLAAILREHSMPSGESDFPADEYECCADAVLAAGFRPPARLIETHAELDALPVGAVVMDAPYPDGDVHQKLVEGQWFEPGFDPAFTTRVLNLPAVLLWSPPEKAGGE
ncbi:hypothetical protein [Nocardia sp. NPDC049149]|uniref:hypothetical protein n=1 Tax=Nocardia sp. NPDC049149 TaxID=3364315 RepID=UPI00371FB455